MSVNYNGSNVYSLQYNGNDVQHLYYNGTEVPLTNPPGSGDLYVARARSGRQNSANNEASLTVAAVTPLTLPSITVPSGATIVDILTLCNVFIYYPYDSFYGTPMTGTGFMAKGFDLSVDYPGSVTQTQTENGTVVTANLPDSFSGALDTQKDIYGMKSWSSSVSIYLEVIYRVTS